MIREFIQYQSNVRGLAPRTCQEYSKNLHYFVTWAQPRGLRWSTVWKGDIDAWTAEMKLTGVQAATIKQRISTLRTFYGWLVNEGKIDVNPARWAQTPKREEKLPAACDLGAVDRWLETPSTRNEEKTVKMLAAIIVETGCRLSEAVSMRMSDFKRGGIVVKGKGRRERIVFYGQRTIAAIRSAAPVGDELFAGWTADGLRWAMYRTMGKDIPNVHPHQLRHTFAMEALNRGLALNEVSQLLGHKHITTTQIYARAATQTLSNKYHQIF